MNQEELILYLYGERLRYSTDKEFAEKIGVSPAYLSDVLKGRRLPGEKFLRGIEFKKLILYIHAPRITSP